MVCIQGMKMPKGCYECKCMRSELRAYDDPVGCVFTGKTNYGYKDRPEDCPLTEAQPMDAALQDILDEIESNMPDSTNDCEDCAYQSGLATAADVVQRKIDWGQVCENI